VAAVLVLGAALATAATLHLVVDPNRQIDCPQGGNPQAACTIVPGHGWVNPAALVISLLGVAAAASVLLPAFIRRLVGAAAIIGLAAATMAWVATYREQVALEGFWPKLAVCLSTARLLPGGRHPSSS
jgi:hypothetical protein